MNQRKLVLTHAQGLLAQAILEKLFESGLAPDSLVLLDDEVHLGTRLAYGKSYLTVGDQLAYDYADCALVLLLEQDPQIEQKLATLDAVILSHALASEQAPQFAADTDASLEFSFSQKLINLPGAEISCLLGVLPKLHEKLGITQINAVILRSAETQGKAGIDELASQSIALFNGKEAVVRQYPLQIAFNLLPADSVPAQSPDLTRLLGDDSIRFSQQIVDVPIFHGFAAALQLVFDSKTSVAGCEKLLKGLKNVQVKAGAASPLTDCKQSFGCVINRVEQSQDQPNTIQFWMLADSLRYGLANNYANVTDILLKSFL